ncbi:MULTISPECIES: hypothetical protein [Klebsiella pneumoniae complex]|uniref:hypothetical protein n=1 Tax=Klebsiella TaxID=570 RepID=UPI0007E91974|nr:MULTISPECIES: hypothetical protein [Klebsiella]EKU9431495.1 hypothetical protein [Klebsiella variicola]MDR8377984.1 hypothetical protein [Acinetobacter baumannii]HDH1429914.1 hypothetical protein [Klebsiella quasipneumoniae subsp. similipneumoniae]HDU5830988.1 hypothetical protein [Klebsiella pneumoniae subsp. pneumoniae]EKX9392411.1 hypothetical protein [Klebsiella pneumoniae]
MANNKNHIIGEVQKGYARIRVGDRGGAYIPSEEIATLPEVQDMQKRAAAIVGRNTKINGAYIAGKEVVRGHASFAKGATVNEQALEQKVKAKA